jgi:hypothetical protein
VEPADTDTVVVKPAVASAEIGVESGVVTTLRPLLHKTVVDTCGDETVLELPAVTIAVLEACPQPVVVAVTWTDSLAPPARFP